MESSFRATNTGWVSSCGVGADERLAITWVMPIEAITPP